ncbi:MAG: DUF969 domain-containing protein [Oscillospiraceae bacterium]|nr:DUF969 domain-containing protein [Oscillospiraceae bacterium]MBP1571505.1 DUF969 domain-containing protein [Oscillospiraceae bacterium]MBQ5313501.1 DUF969 domain-containing protein [Oscillospiraceae bacterium]MBQ5324480.1 DUF969 domain-containing protein [Oscillospiraceae bacterium]
MEYIRLIGIAIVVIGFALKLDSILIIVLAAVATALASGIDAISFLEAFGQGFVANRNITIFILVMLVTGTLERNGLREASSSLIGRVKGATSGVVIAVYGIIRGIFGAFNVGFGGVAGFVRPVLIPMATGTVEKNDRKINENHLEQIKGMSAGMENIAWFFCQVLFVGGAGALLVQSTLATVGYDAPLIRLAAIEIPVAIAGVGFGIIYYIIKDRRLRKKYYTKEN